MVQELDMPLAICFLKWFFSILKKILNKQEKTIDSNTLLLHFKSHKFVLTHIYILLFKLNNCFFSS